MLMNLKRKVKMKLRIRNKMIKKVKMTKKWMIFTHFHRRSTTR